MRVTVCQLDNSDASRPEALEALADHVAVTGPDLVLLPELGLSRWLPANSVVDHGAWLDAVRLHEEALQRLWMRRTVVVGTRPIVDEGVRRNMGFVRGPEGLVDVRAKHYLPDEPGYYEATWYEPGPVRFDAFDAAGATCGMQVCTEMWFFEWARQFARHDVDLLLAPRATPFETTSKWIAGGRAAAVCSGAFCLSSNQWIPGGGGVECGGVGWVIDPDGVVLALTSDAEPFVTVDLDLQVARAAKATYPRYVLE